MVKRSAMLMAGVVSLAAGLALAKDDVPKKPAAKKPAKGSAAKPGERFDLWRTNVPQVGQQERHAYNMKADLVLQYERRKKPLRVESIRLGHELEYMDEVREVNGMVPTKVMRTYRLVHDWATGKADKEKKQVLLTWTPEGFQHIVQGKKKLADLADQYLGYEKKAKEQVMAGVFERMLPHTKVPVGHRWTIPNEVGAAMAGIKLEQLDLKKTRCRGYFLSVRWGKTKKRRYMRIAFRLKLYLKGLGVFSFAKTPALLELKSTFWVPADGARGTMKAKYTGTFEGAGGTHPELPPGVTVRVTGNWDGDVQDEPVRQGKF